MLTDKEELISELEEHLSQVLEECMKLRNPFHDLPHPIVFNAMAGYIYHLENGEFYEPEGINEYKVAAMLDEMMREIIICE